MSEQIRVGTKLHKQVKRIADANHRGMKDQVEYWAANDCPHPTEMRVEGTLQVTLMENGAPSNQTMRVFRCKQCKRMIVVDDAGIGERIGKIVA